MVESKVGVSPYHQIAVIYCRSADGTLLNAFGRNSAGFKEAWGNPANGFMKDIVDGFYTVDTITPLTPNFKQTMLQWAAFVDMGENNGWVNSSVTVPTAYEYKAINENQIRGLILLKKIVDAPVETTESPFLLWFVKLVLTTSRLELCELPPVHQHRYGLRVAQQVTQTFSKYLRNVARGDLWDSEGGKEVFEEGVAYFTTRGVPIEMILPAFPCKSTCLNKVVGIVPDKGEELSLRSIHNFARAVEIVYLPGIKFLIVSDGHVFSDCIGANDSVVDRYGELLVEMRDALYGPESHSTIPFMGLHAMFKLDDQHMSLTPDVISAVDVPVYVQTVHTAEADKCRQLLVAGCGIDGAALRHKIETSDASALALYRGFTKFMCEDLAFHPTMKKTSRSQQKKIAAKVAFEMLKRNQAYSNLVEVLFPAHVRLSIHAHLNNGPKFGINLLGQSGCRTTTSLLADIPETADDLLHIPTPWHNSVIRIVGKQGWFVVKSRIVKDGIEAGICSAQVIKGRDGSGDYTLVTMIEPKKAWDMDSMKCALEAGVGQVGHPLHG